MEKIVHKDLSYKLVGLMFEAHRKLGRYRNEKQFSDYFEKLLRREKISYEREFRFEDFQYSLGKVRCICDFIVEGKILLEFKTKDHLTKQDYYQVKRYLVTLNLQLGIIVNFRQERIVPKRVLNNTYINYNHSQINNSNTKINLNTTKESIDSNENVLS